MNNSSFAESTYTVDGIVFQLRYVSADEHHAGAPSWRAYVKSGNEKPLEHVRPDSLGNFVCYTKPVESREAMEDVCRRWTACFRSGVWA